MKTKSKLNRILFCVAMALFTIGFFILSGFFAIMIPANSEGFYEKQFSKHDTLSKVQSQVQSIYYNHLYDSDAENYIENLDDEELLALMDHVMDYCTFREDDLNPTVDGKQIGVFFDNEISHMADVKNVFGGGFILVGIGAIFFIAGLVILIVFRKDYCHKARRTPFITLTVLFGILLFIILACAINFDKAFEIFHKIFFDGNWQFSHGVMIAMIGDIFVDLVVYIAIIWISLIALFITGLAIYNHALKKKYVYITSTINKSSSTVTSNE